MTSGTPHSPPVWKGAHPTLIIVGIMVANSLNEQAGWQQEAYKYLIEGNYNLAANLYEQAIEAESEVKSHYWHLGLLLLLLGLEEEAHTTWLLGMVEGSSEQIVQWTGELVQVLETEASRRSSLGDYSVAWLIRQHIKEIVPKEIHNLLHLVQLGIEQETLSEEELTDWGVISLLQEERHSDIKPDFLLQLLQKWLDFAPLHPLTLEFAGSCVPHLCQTPGFLNVLMLAAIKIAYSMNQPAIAISLIELCQRVNPNYPELWGHLAGFYQRKGDYSKGIEAAKRCYSLVSALPDKIYANHQVIRALMSAGGYWEEAARGLEEQESLLLSIIEQPQTRLDKVRALRLMTSVFFFPYLRDRPQHDRPIQNQISRLCQDYIQTYAREEAGLYPQDTIARKSRGTAARRLKIGYISHCLNSHSVGWQARWVIQYHSRDRFEIHGYFIGKWKTGDPLQEWYANQVEQSHRLETGNFLEIAKQIERDEIDILIELDSLTLDTTCGVMALKPAPVQVTWIGWDASGIPAVDYFIADPYLIPEEAEDYYTEKIWRLPQTSIAVDGFEVGVPSLRRDKLEIPSDAVVYYSGQTGYKRHPDTARWQMQIIKEVPNSYFLIKSKGEEEAVKNFFIQLAEEEGVSGDRLRFLQMTPETIHRADLGIADVVLDTYPYSGGTTTLETLWMCIPLVTRVGEQWAARQSYSMMMNVGVTVGIAWTDEEYVEWGIRLGLDRALRQQISWRLGRSRQTSPLWNARQFTREMEKAYEQMWQRYLDSEC